MTTTSERPSYASRIVDVGSGLHLTVEAYPDENGPTVGIWLTNDHNATVGRLSGVRVSTLVDALIETWEDVDDIWPGGTE